MPGSKSVNSAILKGYLKHMGFKAMSDISPIGTPVELKAAFMAFFLNKQLI